MAVVEDRFRVMASEARVLLVDPTPEAPTLVRRRLAELEQRWSRFLPDSEISRINLAGPHEAVDISTDTSMLIEFMQQAHGFTDGRFDPTLLREIVEAGYATSIDDPDRRSMFTDCSAGGATVAEIELDHVAKTATLPVGLVLDPGGLGKGAAADVVVAELMAEGTAGAMVGIGGDLAVSGVPPGDDGWIVAVEHPLRPDEELGHLALDHGGIATSSTLTRRWTSGGRARHHLVDPATGTCSTTDLAAVTVVAGASWQAEVHATAAILATSSGVLGHLDRFGLSGVAVTHTGEVLATSDLRAWATKIGDRT
ncbi:MAG: FAD:protein FMN transferase [Actinobacteria bacterium]|nr:FAD:protein FMN transferase [Actinomycetota bacterium]